MTGNNELIYSQTRRGFLYGETVFTSFSTADNLFLCLDSHLDRLINSADFLFGKEAQAENLRSRIIDQLVKIKSDHLQQDLRFRITVFSNSNEDDTLLPTSTPQLEFHIGWREHKSLFELSPALTLHCSKETRFPVPYPSDLKLGNYAWAIHTRRDAILRGKDDVLFFNQRGGIAECSTSNIFFLRNGKIYTPAISADIFAGLFRSQLIKVLKYIGYEVIEDELSAAILKDAQEAFITNSAMGIAPINQIGSYTHFTYPTIQLIFREWKQQCMVNGSLLSVSDLNC